METIFVKIRNDEGKIYESYADIWQIIELSGYKTCELDEIDYDSDNVFVYFPDNGSTRENFENKERKCTLIWWALEFPTWSEGIVQGLEIPPYIDHIWCSDQFQYSLYKSVVDSEPKAQGIPQYVFLGGHPGYGGEPKTPKKWDMVHLSYLHGPRLNKHNILKERGYTMAPNGWGQERDESLAYSTYGLHLHQFNATFIAPQRFTMFASWKLPILSDYCSNPEPYRVLMEGLIHFDPVDSIAGNEQVMKSSIDYNYNLVTRDATFRRCVDNAVEKMK